MEKARLVKSDLVCDSLGRISEVVWNDSKEYLLRYMDNYKDKTLHQAWSEKIDIIEKNYEYVGKYID